MRYALIVLAVAALANAADRAPVAALRAAVAQGNESEVRLLLASGAHRSRTPTPGSQYETDGLLAGLLADAVGAGRLGLVRVLTEYGARSDTAYQPLTMAIRRDYVEIATFLLEHGADPTGPGDRYRTPLMAAAERGQLQMVRLLVEKGANPWVETPPVAGRKTAFDLAADAGHVEVAKYLGREMLRMRR